MTTIAIAGTCVCPNFLNPTVFTPINLSSVVTTGSLSFTNCNSNGVCNTFIITNVNAAAATYTITATVTFPYVGQTSEALAISVNDPSTTNVFNLANILNYPNIPVVNPVTSTQQLTVTGSFTLNPSAQASIKILAQQTNNTSTTTGMYISSGTIRVGIISGLLF